MVTHLRVCADCLTAGDIRAVARCPSCSRQLEGIKDTYLPIEECEDVNKATAFYDFITRDRIMNRDNIRVLPIVDPPLDPEQKRFLRQYFPTRALYEASNERTHLATDALRAIIVRDQLIATNDDVERAYFDCKRVYNRVGDYGFVVFPCETLTLRDLARRMMADGLQSIRVILPAADLSDVPFQFDTVPRALTDHADFEYEGCRFSYRMSPNSDLFRLGYLLPIPTAGVEKPASDIDVPNSVPVIYSEWLQPDPKYENVHFLSAVVKELRAMGMSFEDLKDDVLTDAGLTALIVDRPELLSLIQPDVTAVKVGNHVSDSPAPVRFYVSSDDVMRDPQKFAFGPPLVVVGEKVVVNTDEPALELPDETHCYLSLLQSQYSPPLEDGRFPKTLDDNVIGWMDQQPKDHFVPEACLVLDCVDDGVVVHVQPRGHKCTEECGATAPGYDLFLLLRYVFMSRVLRDADTDSCDTLSDVAQYQIRPGIIQRGSDSTIATLRGDDSVKVCPIKFGDVGD
jgi:hypothetical protein